MPNSAARHLCVALAIVSIHGRLGLSSPSAPHDDRLDASCVVTFVDGCRLCPNLHHLDFIAQTKSIDFGYWEQEENKNRTTHESCALRVSRASASSMTLADMRVPESDETLEARCLARARDFHSRCRNAPYIQTEAVFVVTGTARRFPSSQVIARATRHLRDQNNVLLDLIHQHTARDDDDARHSVLEATLKDLRAVLARLVCTDQNSLTLSGAYCLHPQDPPLFLKPGWQLGHHHFPADGGLVALLQPIFKGHSVLDLGCGCGQYGAVLEDIDYRGFDGSLNVEEFTNGRVLWADLSVPLVLSENASFVMLLEVGEHVPMESEDQLFRNAANHAVCGLVISWAVPGQTGAFHINLRSNTYIREKVSSLGFTIDQGLTDKGRNGCELPWFANTFLFFWKDDAPDHCPRASEFVENRLECRVHSLRMGYEICTAT